MKTTLLRGRTFVYSTLALLFCFSLNCELRLLCFAFLGMSIKILQKKFWERIRWWGAGVWLKLIMVDENGRLEKEVPSIKGFHSKGKTAIIVTGNSGTNRSVKLIYNCNERKCSCSWNYIPFYLVTISGASSCSKLVKSAIHWINLHPVDNALLVSLILIHWKWFIPWNALSSVWTTAAWRPGGEVLPYMGYIGMKNMKRQTDPYGKAMKK